MLSKDTESICKENKVKERARRVDALRLHTEIKLATREDPKRPLDWGRAENGFTGRLVQDEPIIRRSLFEVEHLVNRVCNAVE